MRRMRRMRRMRGERENEGRERGLGFHNGGVIGVDIRASFVMSHNRRARTTGTECATAVSCL